MRRKNTTKQMMKEYISESLLLLMGKKRYADISIAEITAKAGVNRSTYYRNFLSKEEIIKFYLEQIMYSYLAEYDTLADQSMETYLGTIFKHFHQYKTQLLLIYRNDLSFLLLDVLNQFFEQRHPLKLNDTKEQFRLFYHIGGIYNFFILWFSHVMKEEPEELTHIAAAILPPNTPPML